jgi:NhaP-type Na+/H+ or K+/H+ antiporter
VLILASAVVIVSYLFSLIARRTRVPSVLLLVGTGILLRLTIDLDPPDTSSLAPMITFLGTVGLIMIILESSLDLKISRMRLPLIRNALASALTLLIGSTAAMTALFRAWLGQPWRTCLVYAVPLAVTSSAIVLPSVGHLGRRKREFVVYEASFSDILGIMLFNAVAFGSLGSPWSLILFGAEFVLMASVSLVTAVALVVLTDRIGSRERFFLLFAILILLYSVGKVFHLSSLILVMVFGLVANNFEILPRVLRWRALESESTARTVVELRQMTAETSFLVRTFFFVLFGYGIDFRLLADPAVIQVGLIAVAIFLLLRLAYLRFFLRAHVLPELFISPRGLVTVLLFYMIPARFRAEHFSEGVIIFVILATNLLMAAGLIAFDGRAAGERA